MYLFEVVTSNICIFYTNTPRLSLTLIKNFLDLHLLNIVKEAFNTNINIQALIPLNILKMTH